MNTGTQITTQVVQRALDIVSACPPNTDTLRGVVVHQHGCGEGSCKSGLTGAFDLHWQALAAKHDCALLAPSYEQPQEADCQRWCDPRNGSDATFQQALVDLGKLSGRRELASIPWALWGHSGGGMWSGIMTLLHPERVAATWMRSGIPPITPRPDRPAHKTMPLPDAPLAVPMMVNLGTKEGVTVTAGRFSTLWPKVQQFFKPMRAKGCLIGIAIDPLTGHECGNQRYLAIPWFDECLAARLPAHSGEPLRQMPKGKAWLATISGSSAFPEARFVGDKRAAIWLPSRRIATAWMQYVKDTQVTDTTPPPPAANVEFADGVVTWDARADLESGIRQFIIERAGTRVATVPKNAKHAFGRPVFQGLQYSDTPVQPLVKMRFVDPQWTSGYEDAYRVITVNTAGLQSR